LKRSLSAAERTNEAVSCEPRPGERGGGKKNCFNDGSTKEKRAHLGAKAILTDLNQGRRIVLYYITKGSRIFAWSEREQTRIPKAKLETIRQWAQPSRRLETQEEILPS